MNRRVPVIMILALAALLVGAGLWTIAAPGTVAAAQPVPASRHDPPEVEPGRMLWQPLPAKEPGAGYAVQPATAVGGDYRLDPVTPFRATGTPCCCTYLPCLGKRYP